MVGTALRCGTAMINRMERARIDSTIRFFCGNKKALTKRAFFMYGGE